MVEIGQNFRCSIWALRVEGSARQEWPANWLCIFVSPVLFRFRSTKWPMVCDSRRCALLENRDNTKSLVDSTSGRPKCVWSNNSRVFARCLIIIWAKKEKVKAESLGILRAISIFFKVAYQEQTSIGWSGPALAFSGIALVFFIHIRYFFKEGGSMSWELHRHQCCSSLRGPLTRNTWKGVRRKCDLRSHVAKST